MSVPGQAEASFQPFAALEEHIGFVPNLFRAQTLLPRVLEAETALLDAILFQERALSRMQKEYILLALSAAFANTYWVALHYQTLQLLGVPADRLDRVLSDPQRAGLDAREAALIEFARKLALDNSVSRRDVAALRSQGLADKAILEAIVTAALSRFLCTLAIGVGAQPEFEPPPFSSGGQMPALDREAPESTDDPPGPYLDSVELSPHELAPFAWWADHFGFVSNAFRAQSLRLDVLEAEAECLRRILLPEDILARKQKEYILLRTSAADRNTYWVAVHSEILRARGVEVDEIDRIALDHRQSQLGEADRALLDFAVKLCQEPSSFGVSDAEFLQRQGFTDAQALEAVALTALTCFLSTVQVGLGVPPDFEPRVQFRPGRAKKAHLTDDDPRRIADEDAELVARVQSGDLDTFELLMTRHSRRVYRVLVGLLGNADEARDAMQDTFLKAFQHLREFRGSSKFSTWLLSIASNTGLQRLRERKRWESIDEDDSDSAQGFRPRQIQSWADDPEQLYSKEEMRALVEQGVMNLPAKYRVVLVLRDLEQLATEEAAMALGLGIPALKARLLRGRLMLRESLAPHFSKGAKGVVA